MKKGRAHGASGVVVQRSVGTQKDQPRFPSFRSPRIDWGSVVEQMKLRGGAEKGRTIPVYVTDRFHAYSLKFYLRWVDEKGFNVVFADGSGFTHPSIQPRFLRQLESVRVERLDELGGDRFWIIFICDEWQRAEWPQRAFNPAEFVVGDLFSDPLGQVCAFPVWRKLRKMRLSASAL